MANIIVSTELDGESVDVGDLFFVAGRHGTHSVRFTYDAEFVRRGYAIDPQLRLDNASHQMTGLPLAVEDAAPDSWGQALLQRAERMRASDEGRDARGLGPDDFLLASSDQTRQGALRFQTQQDGPYLSEDATIPQMLDMSSLLADAEEVAADPNTKNWQAVQRLLDTGTSGLGGARPKAAVRDDNGILWLAKFPHPDDRNNVPAWEMVALDIADRAGLVVPERRLLVVRDKHVLLVRRFDRSDDGTRIPYISARTMLGARDAGTNGDYGARGLGIARRLRPQSNNPTRDLERLWRQAGFNLLINNTDNHLRNLGFLREGRGWALSPVFDLDPNPDTGTMFATQYDGAVQRKTGLSKLMSIADDIGIDRQRARVVLDEVLQAVDGWDTDAVEYGVPDAEIELFEDVFTGLRADVEKVIAPPGTTTTSPG